MQAVRLFKDLIILGAQPWIDVHDMIAGGDWEEQIERALDETDYVIILLSRNSIEKRGYVQAEKRYILKKSNEMPFGKIFVIPARLEKCQPQDKQLKKLDWVDLFPSWNDGIRRIAKSLELPEEAIENLEATRSRIEQERSEISVSVGKKGKGISVNDYFDVILPSILKLQGEEATQMKKKIRFVLSDSWTVNLSPPVPTVIRKDPTDADLTIKLTPEAMNKILEGNFDARKSLAKGDVEVAGDLHILKSAGVLFADTSHYYDILNEKQNSD
jgi:hypothetical protein